MWEVVATSQNGTVRRKAARDWEEVQCLVQMSFAKNWRVEVLQVYVDVLLVKTSESEPVLLAARVTMRRAHQITNSWCKEADDDELILRRNFGPSLKKHVRM